MNQDIDRDNLLAAARVVDRRAFITGMVGAAGLVGVAACSAVTSGPGPSGSSLSQTGGSGLELKPTEDWFLHSGRIAPASLISGFSGRASILPGEPVPLFVSTTAPTWLAQVYRIGDYGGLGGALVAQAGPFPGKVQPPARSDSVTRMMYAPWAKSAELDSSGWPPGQYLIHVTVNGKSSYVPLTVRSNDSSGRLAVINSATTLAAYNIWGGRNLYGNDSKTFDARSYAVSLDRPIAPLWVDFLMSYEIPLARAADAAGVPLAWMSNIDISLQPDLLANARGALSPGHDEYWPLPYRKALVSLRDAGGNLAFTGANAGYWRVRLADSDNGPGRQVICYKSASLDPKHDSPETTARWRDAPDPKPENQVTGQLYDAFPVDGAMKISDPDFFLFDGTGVREGDTFAHLVGDEIDRYYPDKNAPHPIQLPAVSPVTCRGKNTWSTVAYYTQPSGAGVFATGTMNWTRSLPRPSHGLEFTDRLRGFVTTVTKNLISAMAAGPMGSDHPARDNANEAHLPDRNTTGAA